MRRILTTIAILSAGMALGLSACAIAQWPGTPGWLSRELDWMLFRSARPITGWRFVQLVVSDPGFAWIAIGLVLAALCIWRARRVPAAFAAPYGRSFGKEPCGDSWRRGAVFWWSAAALTVFAFWPFALAGCFNVLFTRPPRVWPGNPSDQAVWGLLVSGAVLLALIAVLIAGAVLIRRSFHALGPGAPGIILAIVIAGVDCLLLTVTLFIAVVANNP